MVKERKGNQGIRGRGIRRSQTRELNRLGNELEARKR